MTNPNSLKPVIKIDDFIFPAGPLRNDIDTMVSEKRLTPSLFYGPPGTGKTTLAKLIPCLLGASPADVKNLNGGQDNSVNDVRKLAEKLRSSAPSFGNFGKHIVVWDEVDLLGRDALCSLKAIIDRFDNNASFIFTTNHLDKISKMDIAFIDRCNCYEFPAHSEKEMLVFAKKVLQKSGKNIPQSTLESIVEQCGGSLRKLLRNLG